MLPHLANAESTRQVAIICDTVPYPTRSGDNQRIAELIEVLRKQGWYVHLVLCGLLERRFRKICLSHVDALHVYSGRGIRTCLRNALRRTVRRVDRFGKVLGIPPIETIATRLLGRSVSSLSIDYWRRYPPGLNDFVAELRARFQWKIVIVEYIWLYPSIDKLNPGVIRMLDTHDIQHRRFEEFASRGMVFPLQITRDEEQSIFDQFDALIAIQAVEAKIIREMCPQSKILIVGSSGTARSIETARPVDHRILYVGGYNGANIDGLQRFLHFIWPTVLQEVPDAKLHVCGYVYRAFTGQKFENVKFLGHQQSLEKEYGEASLVINPAWIGTGLKIKSIEALKRGKPLVTTTKGIEGLPEGIQKSASIAEDHEQFAVETIRLLKDRESRESLSSAAFSFANVHLNEEAVYKELFHFLNQLK